PAGPSGVYARVAVLDIGARSEAEDDELARCSSQAPALPGDAIRSKKREASPPRGLLALLRRSCKSGSSGPTSARVRLRPTDLVAATPSCIQEALKKDLCEAPPPSKRARLTARNNNNHNNVNNNSNKAEELQPELPSAGVTGHRPSELFRSQEASKQHPEQQQQPQQPQQSELFRSIVATRKQKDELADEHTAGPNSSATPPTTPTPTTPVTPRVPVALRSHLTQDWSEGEEEEDNARVGDSNNNSNNSPPYGSRVLKQEITQLSEQRASQKSQAAGPLGWYAKSSMDGLALLKSGPDLLVQTASGQACQGSSKGVLIACRPESLLSSRLNCRPDLPVGQTTSGHACQGQQQQGGKEVPAEDFPDALRRFSKRLSKDPDPFEPWWNANSVRYGRAKRSSQVSSMAAAGQQANRVLRGRAYNNGNDNNSNNDNHNDSNSNNDSKTPTEQQQGLHSPDGTWHWPFELFRSIEATKQHPEQQQQQQLQQQLFSEHLDVPVCSSPPYTPRALFSASQCLHEHHLSAPDHDKGKKTEDNARASACRLLMSGTPRGTATVPVDLTRGSPSAEEWSESQDDWESDGDAPGTAPEFQTPPASRTGAGLSPAGGATFGSTHQQGRAQSLQVREDPHFTVNWQEKALLAGWIPPASLRTTHQHDDSNSINSNSNNSNDRNKAAPWLEPLEDTQGDATVPGSFDEASFFKMTLDSCAEGFLDDLLGLPPLSQLPRLLSPEDMFRSVEALKQHPNPSSQLCSRRTPFQASCTQAVAGGA
ncbi:unnamed protein product, partial [Polarella glacialis]